MAKMVSMTKEFLHVCGLTSQHAALIKPLVAATEVKCLTLGSV